MTARRVGTPPHVLLLTAARERGGAEITMERIAAHLSRDRFVPVLAAPADGPLVAAWRATGADVYGTAPVDHVRHVFQTRRAVAALARFIRARGVAIVHTHGATAQIPGGWAARRTSRPAISHVQDIFDPAWTRSGLLHRVSLMLPRAYTIAASESIAASLAGRVATDRCEVIPNPVETEIVAPVLRATSGPLVLWCGRLQRWKGCHLFLDAARHVLDALPAARFAVVGGTLFGLEPDYATELRRQADRLRLGPAVEFVGHVGDARPWMRAADVFVHSSERPEPFGLVMAEAMIQERPVVAFRHGGAAEIVVDEVTGRLVPVGDTRALGQAILAVLRDETSRLAMGRAARSRAVERYGATVVTARVEAVYDRVLATRGGAAETGLSA